MLRALIDCDSKNLWTGLIIGPVDNSVSATITFQVFLFCIRIHQLDFLLRIHVQSCFYTSTTYYEQIISCVHLL